EKLAMTSGGRFGSREPIAHRGAAGQYKQPSGRPAPSPWSARRHRDAARRAHVPWVGEHVEWGTSYCGEYMPATGQSSGPVHPCDHRLPATRVGMPMAPMIAASRSSPAATPIAAVGLTPA